jgi:hypothetical protein
MSIESNATAMLAGILLAASAAGSLAAEPKCGTFSLTGGEKAINVVDNPPDGPSLGDVRVGNRQLLDQGGNRVADVHFSATLTALPTANTGSVFASQYFVKLADGWIASASVYELGDATDTSQRAGNAVLLVSGGIGAFEGARGKIEIVAGDPPTYVFDLDCG